MANSELARELILQMLHTRMAFRQTIQRVLKAGDIDMTFEMLQVMHCLWKNQGISQQSLAEQTAKDKACLTNLINNLEKKVGSYAGKIRKTNAADWYTSPNRARNWRRESILSPKASIKR